MLRSFLGRKSAATPSRFRPLVEPLDCRINPTFVEGYDAITFAASQSFPAGAAPTATATGDFNDDGKQDVAVLNGSAGTVSILFNTTAAGATSATFAAPQSFALPAGMTPRALAAGDLNSDGIVDLVAVGDAGSFGVVAALLSTPTAGSFALWSGQLPTFHPTALVLGDFDGDGRLDLAANDPATNGVMLARNETVLGGTQLALSPWLRFDAGSNPGALAVGDLNGDAVVDLVIANGNAGTVTALLNRTPSESSAFAFSSQTVAAGIANPVALALADLTHDGIVDLTVAGGGQVAVLANRTRPGVLAFDVAKTYAVGAGAAWLAAADFNRDGMPDIVTADGTDGTVSVLRNKGYDFGFWARQTVAVGANPVGLAVADFNRDGNFDLTTASASGGTVSVLANISGGVSYHSVYGQFGPDLWSASTANQTEAGWSKTLLNSRVVATGGTGQIAASGASRIISLGPIASIPASALTIDPLGRTWAAFAAGGVALFDNKTGTWAGLPGTGATADKLAVSANGDVFADFVGYGIYRYRSATGWQQINGHSATSLDVDASGSVVASFAGVGIGQYIPYAHGWRLIANRAASALTVSDAGTVYASFDETGGISRWSAASGNWIPVAYSAPAVSIAADLFGNVFAAFPGYGVKKFTDGIGWTQLRAADATAIYLGDIWYTDVLSPYVPSA